MLAAIGGQPHLAHIESLEENLDKSQASVSQQNLRPGDEKQKKKRGRTHKHLTIEEEQQYMTYKMITDLFDFEELKTRSRFHIKRYKGSLYRGELEEGAREGQGICVYEIGRVYEGQW